MLSRAVALTVLTTTLAFAHCDSLDGPVVRAAQQALSSGDVNLVLPWVAAAQEAEVRDAFTRIKAVRRLNSDAARLADTWFFETVVRLHRQAEGAPFEGLQPAGSSTPAGIAAADQAVDAGDLAKLEAEAIAALRQGLRQRFERLNKSKKYSPEDVGAGREYVSAYVDFIHFVERSGVFPSLPLKPQTNEHQH